MRDRHLEQPNDASGGAPPLGTRKPGELLSMIEAAQRGTVFAQSLVAKFGQTGWEAAPGNVHTPLRASELVQAVRNEYPFDGDEVGWVHCDVNADFELPGQRDLLYLVLCTLVKNAILALRSDLPPDPQLHIELAHCAPAAGLPAQSLIGVRDNGPGIAPEVLARLTHEPLTTRASTGGAGMGLMFCQRVVSTLGGAMEVKSTWGQGAVVTLYFPIGSEETNKE